MELYSTINDLTDEEFEASLSKHESPGKALLAAGYLQFLASRGIKYVPQWMVNLALCSHDATDLPLPDNMYEARQFAAHLHSFIQTYSAIYESLEAESAPNRSQMAH